MLPILVSFSFRSNIDKIRAEAAWSDEMQRWRLPDVALSKTKLPPAGIGKLLNERCPTEQAGIANLNFV